MNKSAKIKNNFTAFYFFSFGFLFSFARNVVVMLAIEDILAGTVLASTVILIAFGVTDFLSKVLSPFIVRKISFFLSLILFILLSTVALLFIVAIDNINLRFVGVALCGVSDGLGAITFVTMLSYYDEIEKNTSSLQTGVNFSSLIASFAYTGLTTWLCVAPRTTIAACIPLSWLLLVFYALLDKEPLKNHSIKKTSQDNIHYTPVPTTDNQHSTTPNTVVRRLDFFYKVFPFISYSFLTFFITLVSLNSIVTTLIFPSAPFLPRDHFQYYRLLGDVGYFLGGMELVFVSCIFPDWMTFFKIRKMWFLVLLNVGHLMFFLVASWYHFISNVAVILVLCLTQGLIHGSTTVHCLASSTESFTGTSDKGIALGLVLTGGSVGRLTAGLVGLFVEEYLRGHCTNRLMLGKFCLARFRSSVGWNENRLDCK